MGNRKPKKIWFEKQNAVLTDACPSLSLDSSSFTSHLGRPALVCKYWERDLNLANTWTKGMAMRNFYGPIGRAPTAHKQWWCEQWLLIRLRKPCFSISGVIDVPFFFFLHEVHYLQLLFLDTALQRKCVFTICFSFSSWCIITLCNQ